MIIIGLTIILIYTIQMVLNKDHLYLLFFPIFIGCVFYNAMSGAGINWPFKDYFTYFPVFPDFITHNLDKAFIIVFAIWSIRKKGIRNLDITSILIVILSALLVILTIAGMVAHSTPIVTAISSTITFIKVFLLYVAVAYFPLNQDPLKFADRLVRLYGGLAILSLIFSIAQKYFLGGDIDDNFAFWGGNSIASFFLMPISIYYLFVFFSTKKTTDLVMSILVFVAGIIPSTNRATFLYLIACGIGFVILFLRIKRWSVALIIPILTIVFVYLTNLDDALPFDRLLNYTSDIENVGLVKAYMQLPQVFSSYPNWMYLGLGVGNFGSPQNFYSSIFEGTGSEAFYQFIITDPEDFIAHADMGYAPGAIDTINATPIYILVENGLIFFLTFCTLNIVTFWDVSRILKLMPEHRNVLNAIKIVFIFLFISIFFNFVGTYDSLLYFQPWIIILGLYKNQSVLVQQRNLINENMLLGPV